MLPPFDYVRPSSEDEALEHMAVTGAHAHAGGTDLLGCLRDGVFEATRVVSLGRLRHRRGIRSVEDGGLRLGALTTIAEIAGSGPVAGRYPALAQAASEVASPQLRNQGTLGGNLCQRPRCGYFRGSFHCARKGGDTCFAFEGENHHHAILGGGPCFIVHPSDTAPALTAYGASLRLRGRDGEREVPIESFFVLPGRDLRSENVLRPGEIVTEVALPPPDPGARGVYRKVRERGAWDFALVSVATVVVLDARMIRKARVVLGGVAPVPWRSRPAEDALVGNRLDGISIQKAAEAAVREAVPLEHNEYKVPLARAIVEETLSALA